MLIGSHPANAQVRARRQFCQAAAHAKNLCECALGSARMGSGAQGSEAGRADEGRADGMLVMGHTLLQDALLHDADGLVAVGQQQRRRVEQHGAEQQVVEQQVRHAAQPAAGASAGLGVGREGQTRPRHRSRGERMLAVEDRTRVGTDVLVSGSARSLRACPG
eukprot:6197656-Pleurochrysis_carterae.AAC.3